jgi:3-methylcrotonyl-CoA carboxylase alpha subunit
LMLAALADLEYEFTGGAVQRSENQHILSKTLPPWQELGPWRMAGIIRSLTYYYGDQVYDVTLRAEPGERRRWWLKVNRGSDEQVTFVLKREAFLLVRHNDEQVRAYVQQDAIGTKVVFAGQSYQLRRRQAPDVNTSAQGGGRDTTQKTLMAPMAGTIVKVQVRAGEVVVAKQVLVILSAMKMEHTITAPYVGRVQRIFYEEGAVVPGGATIVEMAPEESDERQKKQ